MSENNQEIKSQNARPKKNWENYIPFMVIIAVIPLLIWLGVSRGAKARKIQETYSKNENSGPIMEPSYDSLSPVILNGQTYKVMAIDSLVWMAENLNYDIGEGSLCLDNDVLNCRKYGRLYTFDGAVKACQEIGWRLPSESEWESLDNGFGKGQKSYKALIQGGKTGFNAVLGGGHSLYDEKTEKSETIGSYWSGTEFQKGEDFAWKFAFRAKRKFISRDLYGKEWALSCRCVKSISSHEISQNENEELD